ncbi:MAG: hypothetical protein J0M29_07400 [Chitinophagales bacterium]|nr:hypothetical protein [Chitinophagales bacterium]
MRYIILNLFLLTGSLLPAQTRYYVNAAAGGQNTGISWPDAFNTLHAALNIAQAGDEIWVAEGIYLPTNGADRTASFIVPNGVQLYGGFSGQESSLSERQWQQHPVLLSGNIGAPDDSTDNSYTIMYLENPDSNTVVDGFYFRHGIANYPSGDQPAVSPYRSGGALYIMGANGWAYALIQNCHFSYNYARSYGGAVYVNGSGTGSVAPQFLNCTFEYNSAALDGGALYRNGGSWAERTPDFGQCMFQNNHAERRGGAVCYNESERTDWIDFYDCTFLQNTAKITGGGINFYIGRVSGTNISMKKCIFEKNAQTEASNDQGQSFAFFSSNLQDVGQLVIESCSFLNNNDGLLFYPDLQGQGDFNMDNSIFESPYSQTINLSLFKNSYVKNCIFKQSKAIIWGGVNFNLTNNLILLNSFDSQIISTGGWEHSVIQNNLILQNNKSTSSTYGFFSFGTNASALISNNTILGFPVVLHSNNAQLINLSNNLFYNCKFIREKGVDNSPLTIDYCHMDSDTSCMFPANNNITCGPNNIFGIDPMFRDTAAGDYRLSGCSPLINMGFNAAAAGLLTDLAGMPRIQDGQVDIGAYEAAPFGLAAAPVVHPACAGASNGSILLEPENGCAPYTYQWEPQAGNGPELNGLPPGQYQITLSDASGRQITDTLTVPEAPLPEVSIQVTDVLCGLLNGGQLNASTQSGTAPFSWHWQPVAPDTSALSQLPPGVYALTLTDANGCVDSTSATIGLTGQITLQVGGSPISCHAAADAWLSATPVTGAAPFSWQWLGWPGTDSLAQPLGPGLYAVTVSDRYGCTAAFSYPPLTEPDSLWIGAGVSHQTQSSPPNGAAVVTTISGGTGPFTYLWSNGVTQQATAGLVAGLYTVTVTDDQGCTASTTVEVKYFSGTSEVGAIALHVYPNPASEWVQVQLPDQVQATRLELLDPQGRMVQHWPGQERRLDFSGIPAGAYTLLVRVRDGAVLRAGVVKR